MTYAERTWLLNREQRLFSAAYWQGTGCSIQDVAVSGSGSEPAPSVVSGCSFLAVPHEILDSPSLTSLDNLVLSLPSGEP